MKFRMQVTFETESLVNSAQLIKDVRRAVRKHLSVGEHAAITLNGEPSRSQIVGFCPPSSSQHPLGGGGGGAGHFDEKSFGAGGMAPVQADGVMCGLVFGAGPKRKAGE